MAVIHELEYHLESGDQDVGGLIVSFRTPFEIETSSRLVLYREIFERSIEERAPGIEALSRGMRNNDALPGVVALQGIIEEREAVRTLFRAEAIPGGVSMDVSYQEPGNLKSIRVTVPVGQQEILDPLLDWIEKWNRHYSGADASPALIRIQTKIEKLIGELCWLRDERERLLQQLKDAHVEIDELSAIIDGLRAQLGREELDEDRIRGWSKLAWMLVGGAIAFVATVGADVVTSGEGERLRECLQLAHELAQLGSAAGDE